MMTSQMDISGFIFFYFTIYSTFHYQKKKKKKKKKKVLLEKKKGKSITNPNQILSIFMSFLSAYFFVIMNPSISISTVLPTSQGHV